MDMDDDFIGEIEFAPSPEQAEIISRAISLAASTHDDDDFGQINPLIAIMRWWKSHPANVEGGNSPEAILVEACRQFLLAREVKDPSAR